MKRLNVTYKPANMLVGTLLQDGRDILFEYDATFIAHGLPLSPYRLPLRPGIQKSADPRMRQGLHGLFDDSLPDGWGLLLMDRFLRERGHSMPAQPVDRLAFIGDTGMGALAYEPTQSPDPDDSLFDLRELADASMRVFEGEAGQVLPMLARAGGSPGGARPKVLVGINTDGRMISGEADLPEGFEHWIIKLSSRADAPTAGRLEYAYYLMACDAGLPMMKSTLFDVMASPILAHTGSI